MMNMYQNHILELATQTDQTDVEYERNPRKAASRADCLTRRGPVDVRELRERARDLIRALDVAHRGHDPLQVEQCRRELACAMFVDPALEQVVYDELDVLA